LFSSAKALPVEQVQVIELKCCRLFAQAHGELLDLVAIGIKR
jgi:hypothetical protein